MRRKIIFIFLCIISTLFSNRAFAIDVDSIAHLLEYQVLFYPQEKVYVSTDKNVYVAGDTIRFRAFLVDALKLLQKRGGSKYVHVEVKDPFGKTVNKVKIKENEDSIFAGIIPLSEDLAEGTYTLGAYTLFMKNQGDEYVFRKSLPIMSRLAGKYQLNTSFEGNVLNTSLSERFGDKPVSAKSISLNSKEGVLREGVHRRSNFNFSLDSKNLNNDYVVVSYDLYKKFVRIPKDTSSFTITFHPEGGYMIPGAMNRIAFKALGSNGLSKKIQGVILDSKNNKICEFTSSHKGMGTFSIIPQTEEKYIAIVGDSSFYLPEPNPKATVLTIDTESPDSLSIKINGAFKPGDLLLADNCGIVTFARKLDSPQLKIARENIGSGLTQFYLINSKNKIISSRLIFNRKGYIHTDNVTDVPKGDFTVTSRLLATDSVPRQSIVSELMLQSDIKGHIEDPEYYFNVPDSITDRHLDYMMLTQGWKRYDIRNALKGKFDVPEEPMEIGGEITGTVFSRWKKKPLEGAVVNALAPGINYVGVAQTDASGKFAINGVDWPDGTLFILQVFNKNGNREHNYEIDPDASISYQNLPEDFNNTDLYEPEIFDNGAIWLEELEVTAHKSDEELREEMLKALGVRTVTEEDIKENNITSYEEVIRKIPGLTIMNGNLVHMGSRGAMRGGGIVELWVDGVRWTPSNDPITLSGGSDSRLEGGMPTPDRSYAGGYYNTFQEFCDNYPIHIMKSIQYYRSSVAMVISSSAAQVAGALVLTTKDGSKLTSWDNELFIRRVTPLGYQKAAEAYKPHFEYDPVDETTITSYWYPKVAGLEDFTPLENSDTLIEGITEKGLPYRGIIPAKKQR